MEIQKLQSIFAKHPGVKALAAAIGTWAPQSVIQLSGLQGSSAPLVFAALAVKAPQLLNVPYVFVLDDEEEAGYFYHDLTRLLGEEQVLFFPSSYKRAIKFGQRNAGQEILRTEVLSRLAAGSLPLFIVTHPQALCELVVTKQKLSEQTLTLGVGEHVDIMFVQETLLSYGFHRTDYVYEPGQFAVRGSIIDVYSYSCELPYRIDFFGDEVDSIRTFEVHSQLSRDRQQSISIVPEMTEQNLCRESFLTFLPENTIMVVKDLVFLCDMVEQTYNEGFSQSAVAEGLEIRDERLESSAVLVNPEEFKKQIIDFRRIELKPSPTLIPIPYSLIQFNTHPQPVFHKNFDLLIDAFKMQQDEGTDLYILADSQKQTDRLESIFHDKETGIQFTPVDHALHAGFSDDDLHVAFFTDHQIFDRYHKYNLRSERAMGGKVALTLKELQQFEVGDYVVHIDYGVGKFGGLVRMQNGDQMQEVIKIIYSGDDTVYVSIHSLHKVSKYKGKEGEPPRISHIGTGAWERMKERTKKKIKD
ncbi:MAG: transcription-repair coupling factor, partial [Bacteroidales bacterium]|nr:transcription-repair coupling factor [Bacteroidales bacterium]